MVMLTSVFRTTYVSQHSKIIDVLKKRHLDDPTTPINTPGGRATET